VSSPFFAKASDEAVGSFHYSSGLIELNLSDEAVAILGSPHPVKADGRDVDHLTQLAYEVTGGIHEIRHFVDTFGTIAGLTLFREQLRLLKEFAELCTDLQSSGGRWEQMPVSWALDANAPSRVRNFVRRAKAFDLASEIFIAPFAPVEVEGHHDELYKELEYEQGGGKVDATPVRLGRIRVSTGELRMRTVWYPLGFEAMIEGTAHALARNFVEEYFPREVAERFERRIWPIKSTQDAKGRTDQRLAQIATPYMVVDLLVTRFFRAHGIERFPRDLLLTLVDRVLSTLHIKEVPGTLPGTTQIETLRPGATLVELLERNEPRDLIAGKLVDAPELTRTYASVLEKFEKTSDWTEIKGASLSAELAIWESYLSETFIIPLLRERLNGGGRAFATYAGFFELLVKIGLPPVQVYNGRIVLDRMPPRVQQAWASQLMLSEIMRQALNSSGPVFCPRAGSTIPGLASVNLAFEGKCSVHLHLGCGTYRHRQPAVVTPDCLFENALRVCGLER